MRKHKILILLAIALFIFSALYKVYAEQKALAMVTGIYGKLIVKHQGQKTDARMRMRLFKDDIVSTDNSSKATLLLKDNSEIKMSPNTTITMTSNEKEEKRGLLVTIGKIFARMTKQKSSFQITSPHGAAAIEGTEFQYEVASGKTSVVVADGKVRFGNKRNNVLIDRSKEGLSSSMTNPIASPQTVEYKRLIKWQEEIIAYKELIESFMTNYQSAVNKQRSGVQGSLIAARQECDTMRKILDKLGSMVPDPLFANGHRNLTSALDNYKNALLFYQEPAKYQDFISKADASYQKAQNEFNAFTDAYNADVMKLQQQ
ncbi:MAG: FecR domain-containing protein [Candidatus Xenobiia bacterium LiM19]